MDPIGAAGGEEETNSIDTGLGRRETIMSMNVSDELVSFVNLWDSVPVRGEFEPWTPNEISLSNLSAPNFALTFLPQSCLTSYLDSAQLDGTVNYVDESSYENTIQTALASLNQFFACQPDEVIEAFESYLSPCERYVDGPWNRQRHEIVLSSAISNIPRDRQVCLETAAKDHILHLETMILAEEQEAPTAIAVGQILISGWELWMRCKKKLLNSLSKCSRNLSSIGFQIALADAAQA
jgi:hypothetical protein